MLVPFEFVCPICSSNVESAVDPSQGERQRYVEDCQVCCHPLILDVAIEDGAARATAEPEAG